MSSELETILVIILGCLVTIVPPLMVIHHMDKQTDEIMALRNNVLKG